MLEPIHITKSSGELVPFEEEKLRISLQRVGASKRLIDQIVEAVTTELYEGMSTKAIYKKAFALLRKHTRGSAAKYKLKQAIFEMGPTGYPFEQLVGEVIKNQGYHVDVGVTLQGYCVSHEVDVVARRNGELFIVECKFHSDPGRRSGVQVPLYIHSRFLDIHKKWEKDNGKGKHFHLGWIVTNTRFTEDAIKYANCVGLSMISWDYPKKGNLRDHIGFSGLHPITCLTTLSKRDTKALFDHNVVLCRQVVNDKQILSRAHIEKRKHSRILKEIEQLFS